MKTSSYLDFLSHFGIGGAHPGGIGLTEETLQREDINPTTRILDVGCGTGQTAAYLSSQYGAKVTGIDISPIMVEKARNRIDANQLPVTIIQGSIEDVPLEDNSFDLILSESVLSFVNKPKALAEIYRLLKEDGRFIANEFTANEALAEASEEEVKNFYGFDSILLEEDWTALLQQTGFQNIHVHRQDLNLLPNYSMPEFDLNENIEPALFDVMGDHFHIMMKYEGTVDFRILTCTK